MSDDDKSNLSSEEEEDDENEDSDAEDSDADVEDSDSDVEDIDSDAEEEDEEEDEDEEDDDSSGGTKSDDDYDLTGIVPILPSLPPLPALEFKSPTSSLLPPLPSSIPATSIPFSFPSPVTPYIPLPIPQVKKFIKKKVDSPPREEDVSYTELLKKVETDQMFETRSEIAESLDYAEFDIDGVIHCLSSKDIIILSRLMTNKLILGVTYADDLEFCLRWVMDKTLDFEDFKF